VLSLPFHFSSTVYDLSKKKSLYTYICVPKPDPDVQKPIDAQASQAGILEEIKGALSLLPECKFNHVRRGSNEVAHALAQRASW
jgi:hypothetical protein